MSLSSMSSAAAAPPRPRFRPVLSQFRRNPVQPERLVDLFLGRSRDSLVGYPPGPVRIRSECKAHLQRPLPHQNVVILASGEILHAPRHSSRPASARTSTWIPSRPTFALALLAPLPSTSCTRGWAVKRLQCVGSAGPVTSRSRSPTVSRPRRKAAAAVTFSTPAVSAEILRSVPRARFAKLSRNRPVLCRYAAIDRSTFSSSFAPMRGRVAQLLLFADALQIVDGADAVVLEKDARCSSARAPESSAAPARSADTSPEARRACSKLPRRLISARRPRFPSRCR